MEGKRKRCELPRPLPGPTEAGLGRGLGARPGSPKWGLRAWDLQPPLLQMAPDHPFPKVYVRCQRGSLGWDKFKALGKKRGMRR